MRVGGYIGTIGILLLSVGSASAAVTWVPGIISKPPIYNYRFGLNTNECTFYNDDPRCMVSGQGWNLHDKSWTMNNQYNKDATKHLWMQIVTI